MDLRQVRAIVTDGKVLSSLEPEIITRYLQRTGWSDAGQRRTHGIWARMLSDGIATVVVPNDRGYADYPVRMTELLTTLAVVEDRSQLAVLVDLLKGAPGSGASRAVGGTTVECLEALAGKATLRPWTEKVGVYGDHEHGYESEFEGIVASGVPGQSWVVRFDDDYGTDQVADAALILAAVNALPDLLIAARTLYEEGCRESGHTREHCWDQPTDGWPREEWCLRCRVLEPLFRAEGQS